MEKKLRLLVGRTLLIVMAALVLMFSFGNQAPALAAEEGQRKIIYPIAGDPEQLDPNLNSYSRSSSVLKQLFVGLYKASIDGSTMVPALAESYTVSEDGMHWVFTLKEDLKWSDGSPLTAADIEYAWKRVLNPEVASKAVSDMFVIKNGREYNAGNATADEVGVKALDEKTLDVELAYNAPWFLSLTSGASFAPTKQAVVEGDTPWTDSAATYISNGPFMLKEYRIMDRLELVKNPYYVNAENVLLDAVDIVIIEAAEAELVAFENGEIDIADNLNAQAIEKYRDKPEYQVIYRIGMMYCDFNCEQEPFDNKLVRQAFAMSIDRNIIVERVLQTADQPVFGWVPARQRSLTDPAKSYREVAGDMFAYDVEAAKALLAEAGYADISTFPEVEIVVQTSQAQKDLAQALQAMWQANLGVKTRITTYESSAYWSELDAGNFNIDRNGWTGDYEDPLANLVIFSTGSNGYENRWDNDDYDALIAQIQQATDPAIREGLMIKAEQLLADEMPVMPGYGYADDFLTQARVKGLTKNALGHVLLEYVTVE